MSKFKGDILSIAEGKTGAHRQDAMPELNASLQDDTQAQLGTVSVTQPGSMTVTPYNNGVANTDNTALGETPTQSGIITTSPSNASPATATSLTLIKRFTCFPKLPPELREKIWKSTFPDSRVVTIFESFIYFSYAGLDIPILKALYDNPIALYVNQESRDSVKRFYTTLPPEESFSKSQPYFYFNFSRDTLCLEDTTVLENYMLSVPSDTPMQIYKELRFLRLDIIYIEVPWNELHDEESAMHVASSLLNFWRLDTLVIDRAIFLDDIVLDPDLELVTKALTRAWQKEVSKKGYLVEKFPRIVWRKDS